jgi:UDP-3-O-[3-hydroxymyristoyl] glucosamine N-acyltransferase
MIGAGGLATEIYDWYCSDELDVIEPIKDPMGRSYKLKKRKPEDIVHVIEESYLNQHEESLRPIALETFEFARDDKIIIAINDIRVRRRIAGELNKNKIVNFATVCHSKSSISNTCTLENGCIIGAFTRVNPNVYIGSHSIINNFCSLGNRVELKAFCSLASHVDLHDSVTIGTETFISSHAVISAKLRVGMRCKIGANCFVNRDLQDDSLVVASRSLSAKLK